MTATAMALLLAVGVASAAGTPAGAEVAAEEVDRLAEIELLKDVIHTLPAAEAARRFAALRRRVAPPQRQQKIDHFVVLYMENQAFLRTLGCLDLPGLDGVPKGGMLLKNGTGAPVNVTCGTGEYVCDHGPEFSFLDAFFDKGANASFYPCESTAAPRVRQFVLCDMHQLCPPPHPILAARGSSPNTTVPATKKALVIVHGGVGGRSTAELGERGAERCVRPVDSDVLGGAASDQGRRRTELRGAAGP